jgi:ABC-type uncharacterized transport system ATPase subunit
LEKEKAEEAELANLMIGKELVTSEYKKVEETKEKILTLDKVCYNQDSKHNGISEITLTIGAGEILGIAGVDGNGQSQLAQVVTGVIRPEEGSVLLKSEKIVRFLPARLIEASVSHIPEDRNKMGLIGNMSVKENLVLKSMEKDSMSYKKGFFLKKKAITSYANEMKEKYDIRCASVEQEIRNLSGGNQQKIVLARELEEDPELLVAVHPTRGLDIGATKYVHDKMIAARDKGCGILLISADFDEVLKLSDRIAVMYEGRIVGVYPGKNPPIKEISLAMAGKAK